MPNSVFFGTILFLFRSEMNLENKKAKYGGALRKEMNRLKKSTGREHAGVCFTVLYRRNFLLWRYFSQLLIKNWM
jgi:hypothetical protein